MKAGDRSIEKNSGYSGTPLAKKLGIKAGFKILLINAPEYYFNLFTDLPECLTLVKENDEQTDFVHFFTKDEKEFTDRLPQLKEQVTSNGIIWVSWPKKASKVVTNITESIIRNYALKINLVDIKICAVDEIWSGLKLVIPLKNR